MIDIVGKDFCVPKIDTVLFDKDGTLMDSNVYWGEIIKRRAKKIIDTYEVSLSEKELCLKMGYDTKEEKLLEEGPIAIVSRNRVIEILEEYLIEQGCEREELHIDRDFVEVHQQFKQDMLQYVVLLDGVKELLTELKKQKVKIGIVTSDTVDNTKKIMEHLGCLQEFDCLIGKESTKEDKMSGIPAKLAMKQLEAKPENTLCVGDTDADIQMAKNAGCRALAVATGQIRYGTLLERSRYTVEDLKRLEIRGISYD